MPYLTETLLDQTIVAPSIFGDFPHHVTETSLVIEPELKAELETFMRSYAAFLSADENKCYRLDVYFTSDSVHIIEVNVEVADGWGVALNLERAAGFNRSNGPFPGAIPTFPGDLRQTEFQLAIDEFARLGHCAWLCEQSQRVFDPLDNKVHLARFADGWMGKRVFVPKLYYAGNSNWDDIPEDVYLKFADKFCPEAVKARYSAKSRSELGRAKQMKRLFNEGRSIAQAQVAPFRTKDGEIVQAVLMCFGTEVVTGYIQVASAARNVINDKGTKKGALCFQ